MKVRTTLLFLTLKQVQTARQEKETEQNTFKRNQCYEPFLLDSNNSISQMCQRMERGFEQFKGNVTIHHFFSGTSSGTLFK